MKRLLFAASAVALVAAAGTAQARDQISIVGSSTVFPYTQAVAEQFSSMTGAPSPVVESTGTGGGMQIFCAGVGESHPDITGASRAMKASEHQLCTDNGVTDVTEVLLGFDGLSLAHSIDAPDIDVSKAQLYLALAAEVPVDGGIVANPYTNWSQIDSALPDQPILVYGPPPTSGTRDAWVELVMEEGCGAFETVTSLEEDRHDEVCQRMRTDGVFVEAGENDNLIIQRLVTDADAFGIFGYSFLFENQDRLTGAMVEGVTPTADTIESGEYGISRPLFFYIKNAHRGAIPNLDDFIAEYVSEAAMGPGGYLQERGLVPLGDENRKAVQDAALSGATMEAPAS